MGTSVSLCPSGEELAELNDSEPLLDETSATV
jgi:hypothetical protein